MAMRMSLVALSTCRGAEPMPARTGAAYIAGLQECVAEVYLYGGQVQDVTTHHALRHGVRTLARPYDMPHDPVLQDSIMYVSPTIRERVGLSFVTPRTVQYLERRRTMITWARK